MRLPRCRVSIHMESRTRSASFALLLLGLSCLVLLQALLPTQAYGEPARVVGSIAERRAQPLQTVNSTISANSTASASLPTNSTTLNSTSVQSLVATSVAVTSNQSNAVSYLQYQVTSLGEQVSAMSSTVQSLNQQMNMSMVVAEVGLIVGILAFIAALAVSRRADAMFRETSASQTPSPATPKK